MPIRAQEGVRTGAERQRGLRSSKAGKASLSDRGLCVATHSPLFFASMARYRLSGSVGGSDILLLELYAVELGEDLRGRGACLAIAVLRTRLLALLLCRKRACGRVFAEHLDCRPL